mmetsp:Transcript_7677/g.22665  ORF Transcript_7677/g.22665 Transcript_7677/m.22665 type:complete len:333 (+) Transcript_7677:2718-3716(+)
MWGGSSVVELAVSSAIPAASFLAPMPLIAYLWIIGGACKAVSGLGFIWTASVPMKRGNGAALVTQSSVAPLASPQSEEGAAGAPLFVNSRASSLKSFEVLTLSWIDPSIPFDGDVTEPSTDSFAAVRTLSPTDRPTRRSATCGGNTLPSFSSDACRNCMPLGDVAGFGWAGTQGAVGRGNDAVSGSAASRTASSVTSSPGFTAAAAITAAAGSGSTAGFGPVCPSVGTCETKGPVSPSAVAADFSLSHADGPELAWLEAIDCAAAWGAMITSPVSSSSSAPCSRASARCDAAIFCSSFSRLRLKYSCSRTANCENRCSVNSKLSSPRRASTR